MREGIQILSAGNTDHTRLAKRMVMVAVVVLLLLTAVWRLTPLSQYSDPQSIASGMSELLASPWAPLSLALVYLVGNALIFPNIALNLAVIVVLGPVWGVPAALAGTLLAGTAAFLLGQRFGLKRLEKLNIAASRKPLKLIRDSGLPGMILMRMLPIAPYPVVNLVVGAGGVGLGVFSLGTLIGVTPSLIAMGAAGFQLREIWHHPNAMSISILLAIMATYAVLGWLIKRRFSSRV